MICELTELHHIVTLVYELFQKRTRYCKASSNAEYIYSLDGVAEFCGLLALLASL